MLQDRDICFSLLRALQFVEGFALLHTTPRHGDMDCDWLMLLLQRLKSLRGLIMSHHSVAVIRKFNYLKDKMFYRNNAFNKTIYIKIHENLLRKLSNKIFITTVY